METETPCISILMPVKNAAVFLIECLNSILAQSHANWQLIAIDDHSTDNSKEILKEYAEVDKRIQVYVNRGQGIIAALQTSESKIQGSQVTRMDADDIMPSDKLKLLSSALKEQPNSVATGKVKYFASEKLLAEGYKHYEEWLNNLIESNSHWNNIYKECVIASPNWLMTCDTLKMLGGISSGEYPEDYELVFRMYQHKLNVECVNEVTHLWRDHGKRTSRTSKTYLDNSFHLLKSKFILEVEAAEYQQVVLWGAGTRGKKFARSLKSFGVDFIWVSENKKKVGHIISDLEVQSKDKLEFRNKTLVLVATSQDHERISNFCARAEVKFLC